MATPLLRLALLLTLVAGLTFSITTLPTRAQTPAPLDPGAFELHEMGRMEDASIRQLQEHNGQLVVGALQSVAFYNLDDPGRPRLLSSIALPDMLMGMQVVDDYLYASWGSCESITGECEAGLDIYDVALPTAPTLVSRVDNLTHPRWDFVVIDGKIYLPEHSSDLMTVIDVSNLSTPIVRRNVADAFPPFSTVKVVELAGARIAYIGSVDKLIVYDLDRRRKLSEIQVAEAQVAVSIVVPVTTADNRHFVYVADRRLGLRVVEVSDPTKPVLYDTVLNYGLTSVVPGDGVLYASNNTEVLVFDLADPTTPTHTATHVHLGAGMLSRAGSLLVGSNYVDAIVLADIHDRFTPQPVGSIPLIGGFGKAQHTRGHLFTLSRDYNMVAVDVQRPAALARTQLPVEAEQRNSGLFVIGDDLAIVPARDRSWQVFDVSDPIRPQFASQITSPDTLFPMGAALTNVHGQRIAYLLSLCQPWISPCTHTPELRMVNLDDPARPQVIHVFAMPPLGIIDDFAVQDGYAYLIYALPGPGSQKIGHGQLQIIDLRSLNAPELLGSVEFIGQPQRLAISDGLVYVAAWRGGLHAIDVSNAATPQLLSSFKPHQEMQATAVAVDGPVVYFSTSYDRELFTLDMHDPTQPRLVDERIIPGGSAALTIVGDQLIASGSGMTIYRRGPLPPGAVVDLRGAPMTDVSVTMTAGARSGLAAAAPSRATDVNGRFSVQGAATGTQLTPSFGEAAFWPATRTLAQQPDALRFTMLPPPVTAEISAEAATTLTLTDTQGLPTTFTAPAGSLSGASAVTLSGAAPTQTDGLQLAGQAFELRLVGADARFAAPATVTVPYSRGDVRLISDHTQLALYRQTGSGWALAETGCATAPAQQHDAAERTIITAVCAPGVYALLGPTERVYLPALAR